VEFESLTFPSCKHLFYFWSSAHVKATGFVESVGCAVVAVEGPILQIIRNLSSPNPLPLLLLFVSVALSLGSFAMTANPPVDIVKSRLLLSAQQLNRIGESRWGKVERECSPLPTWFDYRYFELRRDYKRNIIVFSTHLDLLLVLGRTCATATTF
jgi:hypothetical protein